MLTIPLYNGRKRPFLYSLERMANLTK